MEAAPLGLSDPMLVAPVLVVGVALMGLWRREPARAHLGWWGAATLLVATGIALLPAAYYESGAGMAHMRVSALLSIAGAFGYAAGARAFRGLPSLPLPARHGAPLALLVAVAAGTLPWILLSRATDLLQSLCYLAAACYLWPAGPAARLAALLLLLRALNPSFLTTVIDGYEPIDRFRIVQIGAFTIGLLLVVADYLRSVRALEALRGSLAARVDEATRGLRAAREELDRANHELEAFTYGISHDLRAPLRTVDGFSRMLEEDCAGALDDASLDAIAGIRARTAALGALLDDLLQVSRHLRAVPQPEWIEPQALLRRMLAGFHAHRAGERIALEDGDGARCRCDPALLETLLGLALEHLVPRTALAVPARIALRRGAAPEELEIRAQGLGEAATDEGSALVRDITAALLQRVATAVGAAVRIDRAGPSSGRIVLRFAEPLA